jgi:oxygen-independent coproporphyrinogen-3 oxidase
VNAWETALLLEIELREPDWRGTFDTVYFGGGTPSLLAAQSLERLLASLGRHFDIAIDAEVTVEANPGTLSRDDYAQLTAAGVNRLSLGIQSFDDDDLVFLGRDHNVRESLDAYKFARAAGIENITVDLIYGLPARTSAHWADQLQQCVSLRPDHVSAYALTYESGTALTRQKERGDFEAVSEELAADLFDITVRQLALGGLDQYEVSSFASRPERESRHNKKYWCGASYLGLGPSAHSFHDGQRWWNLRNVTDYVAALERSELPLAEAETLTPEQRRIETLFLGLRWRKGVDLDRFDREFGEDLRSKYSDVVEQLLQDGLALEVDSHLRLSPAGLARADSIVRRLS